jgi:cyclophilin family peptidyl-prolyl cis-trans isomerase
MRFKLFLTALAGLFAVNAVAAQTPPAPPLPADPQNILNLDLSTGGRVSILMRPDKAPNAVERIRTLTRRGFYNGLTFHRVIDGFMAQGGDPKGTGEGGSELPDLKAEFNDMPHVRGVMSMARSQAEDSANSQFFIMLSPNLKLDGRYTPIGRVISGMNYVDLIEKGEPPEHPSRIVSATIGAEPPVAAAAVKVPPVASAPLPASAPAAEAAKQEAGKAAIETAIGDALKEEQKAPAPKN